MLLLHLPVQILLVQDLLLQQLLEAVLERDEAKNVGDLVVGRERGLYIHGLRKELHSGQGADRGKR